MSWGDLIADDRFWPTKAYSPLRRWLRQERARVHQDAIALDVETVMEWRPSRTPTFDIVSPLWRVPGTRGPLRATDAILGATRHAERRFDELAPWQDVTEGDETVFATPPRDSFRDQVSRATVDRIDAYLEPSRR